MKCSNCGTQIEAGERYCGNCGQEQPSATGMDDQVRRETSPEGAQTGAGSSSQVVASASKGTIALVSATGKPILRGAVLIILAVILIVFACIGVINVINGIVDWIYGLFLFGF